jgi:creatinine amidohydrolase/Fe(II)-dependent formamide hydrolase-like protein
MPLRPAEELRPRQIIAARDACGCAFIPVSPTFEWHSFHLPLGTDGLIAEGLCRAVAAEVGGIYFRALSFGLDAWRTEDELARWGLEGKGEVFGMRFPDLPISSEYCELPELRAAVSNRVRAVAASGFRHAFIVNNHGGRGQMDELELLAGELDSEVCQVHSCRTHQFCDLDAEPLRTGGHAGVSETTWLLAFRPELVDLCEQEEGELLVSQTGILHGEPHIPAEWNPRRVSLEVAHALRARVAANFAALVREAVGAPT